jgi:ATPase subunit of ABC transporter with duplicated ATPase domains
MQDLEAIIWLQHHLKSLPQTVIITSHDQALLDAVAEETIALRHKGLRYFPGPPSEMHEAEEKERLGKVKQQAALDKKKEHVRQASNRDVRIVG